MNTPQSEVPSGTMPAPRSILFVTDDLAEVARVKGTVTTWPGKWNVAFARSWKSAMTLLSEHSFDVVMSEFQMKRITGLEFLNYVWKQHPKTVRFVVADEADHEVITGCVLGSHQFLAKPIDLTQLRAMIERVFLVDGIIASREIKNLVSRIRGFPTIPSLHFEVMKELGSPTATAQSIGERIAKDLAMTTKMIQMVNSAYFGLQRQISDPAEAVMVLGTETVRSLVLGIQAFAQADRVKPLYFSIDRIWRHSLAVATAAKQITLRTTGDERTADTAYTAGLLHDVGKVILAANFDAQYSNALTLAKKQNISPTIMEREIFGVTHAETGAYMLSLWGLPLSLIEAVALHHAPSNCPGTNFSALTALHVANVLEHERNPGQDGFLDPQIDDAYLAALGLQDYVEGWRVIITGGKAPPTPAPKPLTMAAPPPEPPAEPEPVVEESVTPAPRPARLGLWAPLAAAAAVVLLSLIGWKVTRWLKQEPVTVLARTTESTENAASAPAVETVEPNASAATATNETAIVIPIADPAPLPLPGEASTPTTDAQVEVIKPVGFAGLKLQGIILSGANPSAMINGQMLRRGESIQDAKVLEILRDEVVLEYAGEKRSLRLPAH